MLVTLLVMGVSIKYLVVDRFRDRETLARDTITTNSENIIKIKKACWVLSQQAFDLSQRVYFNEENRQKT